MKKLTKVPAVKNWEGMSIINSMMFYKEAIKREINLEKRELLQKRLNELKLELENYKAA